MFLKSHSATFSSPDLTLLNRKILELSHGGSGVCVCVLKSPVILDMRIGEYVSKKLQKGAGAASPRDNTLSSSISDQYSSKSLNVLHCIHRQEICSSSADSLLLTDGISLPLTGPFQPLPLPPNKWFMCAFVFPKSHY